MWILLLDHSESMGRPFQGQTDFAGRKRTAQAAIKLAAAKSALIEHLAGIGGATRLALFGFTATASLLYEGMSGDQSGVQRAIDPLQAENGTDIAAALDAAGDHIRTISGVPIFRVLLISDGLSDRERAAAAAQRLVAQGVVIDVILIDPTAEGEAVARAIALNGSVAAVTSPAELAKGVAEAAQQEQELARQAEAILAAVEEEARGVAAKTAPEEKLAFTAGYPGAVSPDTWYSLLVYLHLDGLQAQVAAQLQQRAAQLGLKPQTTTAGATRRVRRGEWLRLTPHVESVTFNPLSQEVAWHEDVQEVPFRLRAEAGVAGRILPGYIDVHAGPVLIAMIPLALAVRKPSEPEDESQPVATSAQIFGRIFASYSHQDTPIIDACVAAYEALGIYVYIDKQSLRSGQQWKRLLHQFIEESDCFQLYWSQAASKSPYVEDEWRHALALTGRKGEHFIRPLRWEEEWPRPPAELGHLHFAPLDLAALEQQTKRTLAPAKAAEQTTLLPVPVTVLPVLPGPPPEMVAAVREDAAYAVSFLEQVTALRYYPAPTLLVDEHIVRSIRAVVTTDLAPPTGEEATLACAWRDILQAIALGFHSQNYTPPDRQEEFATAFGAGRLLSEEQFHAVQMLCEAAIDQAVDPYIQPAWLAARAEFRQKYPEIDMGDSLSSFVLTALDMALAAAAATQPADQGHRGVIYGENSQTTLQQFQAEFDRAGIAASGGSFSLELSGSARAFLSLLAECRQQLATRLPRYDDSTRYLAPQDTADERLLAVASLAGAICREVIDWQSPAAGLWNWLHPLAQPGWRQVRDELAKQGFANFHPDLDFGAFLAALLQMLQTLLEEGLHWFGDFSIEHTYAIARESWENLRRAAPDLALTAQPRPQGIWEKHEMVSLSGPFREFVRLFGLASEGLLQAVRSAPTSTVTQRLFLVEAPTYGIFVPSDAPACDDQLKHWALARQTPTELTLPQTARVLFCLSAYERMARQLQGEAMHPASSQRLARAFQRSVLIHEHFHAILETGLDDGQRMAAGPAHPDIWQAATGLNESLAVWMELHAAREDPELARLVWEYIRAGDYPAWPYRGAERVEAIYQEQGLDGVRQLILSLRKDPEAAHKGFDTMQKAGGFLNGRVR